MASAEVVTTPAITAVIVPEKKEIVLRLSEAEAACVLALVGSVEYRHGSPSVSVWEAIKEHGHLNFKDPLGIPYIKQFDATGYFTLS